VLIYDEFSTERPNRTLDNGGAMNHPGELALVVIVAALFCAGQPPVTPVADDQVTVKELVIKGGDALSSFQVREAKGSVEGQTGTMESLMDTARLSLTASLKSDCYLNPDIELFSMFRKDGPADDVTLRATVKDGVRYTLRNFRIQWDKTIPAQEIERALPLDDMRRGDCRGLNDVENTVGQLYRQRGYPNVKVHPLIQPNGATRQFDLTLYVDEGTRSR